MQTLSERRRLMGNYCGISMMELEGARRRAIWLHLKIPPSLLGAELVYFSLVQHLICMPGLARLPVLIPRQCFNLMQKADSVLFRGRPGHLGMFTQAGSGDKATDRCRLLALDLSR